jgi:hypothetical protein
MKEITGAVFGPPRSLPLGVAQQCSAFWNQTCALGGTHKVTVEYAAKTSTKNENCKKNKSDVPAKKQSTTKATTTATERQMILHP